MDDVFLLGIIFIVFLFSFSDENSFSITPILLLLASFRGRSYLDRLTLFCGKRSLPLSSKTMMREVRLSMEAFSIERSIILELTVPIKS